MALALGAAFATGAVLGFPGFYAVLGVLIGRSVLEATVLSKPKAMDRQVRRLARNAERLRREAGATELTVGLSDPVFEAAEKAGMNLNRPYPPQLHADGNRLPSGGIRSTLRRVLVQSQYMQVQRHSLLAMGTEHGDFRTLSCDITGAIATYGNKRQAIATRQPMGIF